MRIKKEPERCVISKCQKLFKWNDSLLNETQKTIHSNQMKLDLCFFIRKNHKIFVKSFYLIRKCCFESKVLV